MTPATGVIPQTPAARLKWALRDGWTVAHRDLSHWAHQPGQIVAGLIFPIVFIILFGYVFGSGMIVPGDGDYIDFLMAGLFAQTMAFGIGETMVAVNTDAEKGITDRFRSLPMAQSATRDLFGNAGASPGGSWIAENAMMMAIVWPLLIVVVTLPLAVRRYQSLSR